MIYVTADIHGNEARFRSVMKQIDLRPEDTLYILGDVIDRGAEGVKLLREIMTSGNIKMLLGNHEYMMLKALYYPPVPRNDGETPEDAARNAMRLWYKNGGDVTHYYLKHNRIAVRREIFAFLDKLPMKYELNLGERKFILVHAGLEECRPLTDWHISAKEYAVWTRAPYEAELKADETMIFGHTPTYHFQNCSPVRIWYGDQRIGIDCGCAGESGALACLRLDDMKEFYSE